ncbi:hypothetical protein N5912_02750 [Arcobacter lacus]|uniref:hypothetical protein n=1 Tax=Arcobacter lacus TaxID=1912876 RepID=UPI0021BABFE7|nr:hypothetical protein [Arcobacter lacus]MCT7910739.1 hypothetical protein [Arcobacter lacus]
MKKIINIASISLITMLFTACAPNEIPMKAYPNKNTNKVDYISFDGSVETSSGDEIIEVQNIALMINKAAQTFDKEGIKYFYLTKTAGVPPMINNFENLVNYCYPEYYKKSSLEDKCNLTPTVNNSNVKMGFVGLEESALTYDKFVWSVKDVLNDKNIQKVISEALKEYDVNEIIFKEK